MRDELLFLAKAQIAIWLEDEPIEDWRDYQRVYKAMYDRLIEGE